MRTLAHAKWLVVPTAGTLVLLGCAAADRGAAPVAQTPLEPEPAGEAQAPPPAANQPLVLFGDEPGHERVPFENRMVTNFRQHTFTSIGLDFDPDLAPDGQWLAFATTRNANHPDIYLKKPDGTALTQLTGDPADDVQPRFSPDGEFIAFASNRTGNWDIWLIGRDGTGLTQLTHDRTDEVAPCWSPDGSQIAYTVWGGRSHTWEIWTLDIERPGARRFLAYGMFPAWSPDGTRLAFQRARQRGSRLFSIWTVDLEDGEARHPTEVAYCDDAACVAPRWSPDGGALVYCVVRPEGTTDAGLVRGPQAADVWAVDLGSGLRMKLTDGAAPAFNPVWAPDGRIFFVSVHAGTENIWSLTADLTAYARGRASGPRVSQGPADETALSGK